jgi:hypothetical protein
VSRRFQFVPISLPRVSRMSGIASSGFGKWHCA